MKFSILITTYNQCTYLQECIESVFAQTYKKLFQIVVVNDASNDGEDSNDIKELSLSKTRAYLNYNLPRAKHIKTQVIHNERNLGIAKSFNVGMYYCEGEWVAILDHDDKLLPNCLEEISKFIDANDNTKLGIVYTNLITSDNQERRYPDFVPGSLLSCYKIGNLTLYKRKALEEVNGWKVELDYSHDTACIISFVECGWEIKHIDKTLLWNRIHDEQFTQQYYRSGNDPDKAKQAIARQTLHLRPDLWVESRELVVLNKSTPIWANEALALKPYCKGMGIDIGCGRRKRYPYAMGVDIDRAGGKLPEITCDVEKEELPFLDESLDYIIACHIVEHFENPIDVLMRVSKKLKTHGHLLLIMPDANFVPTIGQPKADPTHKWDFTTDSFRRNIVPKLKEKIELVQFNTLNNRWSFDAFFRRI